MRRILVEHGYTHSFCTPHIWKNLPANNVANIPLMTAALQTELENQNIALKLFPGGENNIQPELFQTFPDAVVTFGMNRKFVLIDLWADKLPEFFTTQREVASVAGIDGDPGTSRADARGAGRSRDRRILHGTWRADAGQSRTASAMPRTPTLDALPSICSNRIAISVSAATCMGSGQCHRDCAGLKRVAEAAGDAKFKELTWDNPKRCWRT